MITHPFSLMWHEFDACVAVARWARRLSEMRENPHRLRALRSEVAKFAQEHWSWERTAAEYAKLLDSIELRKPAS